ncbi:GPI mannosyltransferase 1 [Agrilus planipennis]|uniref:GPI alpha-1,4-mannosyltransferase I, catalytic subunit n=1 Tax=Agrilus planipennis TaxID=224129 RepID=A0A1W4WVN6_AGRPL|nr:GPI mannosyltransferase 1 [Agrilus planipennis]
MVYTAETFLSFRQHIIFAFFLRLALILYGNYHDRISQVPYTDVDYKVFTDASRYVLNNESPYQRHTYRYTPILSWLLIPNLLIDICFGKILFSLIDIFAGILIKFIIKHCVMSYGRNLNDSKIESVSNFGMIVWLYNPITIGIATRGNSDSIAGFLVLLTLYLLQCKKWYFVAGIVHGLAIHVRIYPLMYSLALFLFLSDYSENPNSLSKESKEVQKTDRSTKRTIFRMEYLLYFFPNIDQLKLMSGCILSLVLLTSLFYFLYGYQFLYESYIYHFLRKDMRHNFSLYFYLQYLTAGVKIDLWQKMLITLPQFILIAVFSFKFGLNKLSLNFAILMITCVFVTYNSVITSQYFVWILAILPLCIWQIRLSRNTSLLLGLIWIGAQALWLLSAYLLEFQGLNMFLYIWLNSVSFFCANIACMAKVIEGFTTGVKVKVL